jgi:hypothetical protein
MISELATSYAVLQIRNVCPGSRILIFIHPGSRIPDPTTPNEEGENFCSHKYHKIENNFIFEQVKKIILPETLRIIVLLPKN